MMNIFIYLFICLFVCSFIHLLNKPTVSFYGVENLLPWVLKHFLLSHLHVAKRLLCLTQIIKIQEQKKTTSWRASHVVDL